MNVLLLLVVPVALCADVVFSKTTADEPCPVVAENCLSTLPLHCQWPTSMAYPAGLVPYICHAIFYGVNRAFEEAFTGHVGGLPGAFGMTGTAPGTSSGPPPRRLGQGRLMTSLWLDRPPIETDDDLPVDRYDHVVVGAGLTGLMTALLLARAGRSVVVLEARQVGAVTTGNTTGKVSLLQGTKLSTMLGRQSRRVVSAYLDANREGQQWLLRFCEDHDVPFQTRDAVTYAADGTTGLRQARREHDAAVSLGLPVRWEEELPVPFPHAGATVLPDQAQLDSMDVLAALTQQVRAHGGVVVEGRRVVSVSRSGEPTLTLQDGSQVRGQTVVLATGIPVLDRGLYFAKVEPLRSYALAFDHPSPPELMMLGVGSPSRSVRDAPGRDGRSKLLVGGEGHAVGRVRSESERYDRLRAWTNEFYPGAVETHAWSAQDYASHDGIPFVGRLPRGGGHIYLATGYDKWGMTNAVAAGLDLAGQLLGEAPSWGKRLHHRVTRPRGALQLGRINAGVGVAATVRLAKAELGGSVAVSPAEGRGEVGRVAGVPVGTARVDGESCAVRAVCTHLGGVLKWNDAETSWDCPLHGSRFSPTGEVLEGPATKPLRRHPSPPS
jgi:glycine/D-amino acid oxidase-like deaminating enzyme/nitrite reductase/ring-hydroxylating ferredoxin subunit